MVLKQSSIQGVNAPVKPLLLQRGKSMCGTQHRSAIFKETGMYYSVVIPGILPVRPVRETLVETLSGGQAREPGRLSHTRRRESVHASMTAEKSRDAQRVDASSFNDAAALSQ